MITNTLVEYEVRDDKGAVVAVIKTKVGMFDINLDSQPGKPYTITLREITEHAKDRIGHTMFAIMNKDK